MLNSWSRKIKSLSLRQRLPLLTCLLLLVIIISFSAISYYGVKKTTMSSGSERINALSSQLSDMLSQSASALSQPARTIANEKVVKDYVKGVHDNTAISKFLKSMALDTSVRRIDLLDAASRLVFKWSIDSTRHYAFFDTVGNSALSPPGIYASKFYHDDDSIFYAAVSPINENTTALGFVLVWRKINNTKESMEQLMNLLGANSKFYIGNRDQSLWVDLIRPVADPLPEDTTQHGSLISFHNTAGEKQLASIRPVAGTAWFVMVEFPENQVMQPANKFLRWVVLLGTIMLALGIFLAWLISRNLTRPLQHLTKAVTSMSAGNYQSSVAVDRYDELGKLARAFNAMTRQVEKARADLEHRVIESGKMNEQLRELSAHLQNIREEERIHIAREMHDELGQLLTGFKMDVSWLHRKISAENDPAVKEKLEEMMEITNDAAKFVRKLASELRPSILDDLGLVPALDWHSQEFSRRSNIEVNFHASSPDLKLPELVATGLFRMYQESLTNVARHSEAKKVTATLDVKDGFVNLSIADDGKGFDSQNMGGHKTLGLLGMNERAMMIGGTLNIQSQPGKGTTINIAVPLRQPILTT